MSDGFKQYHFAHKGAVEEGFERGRSWENCKAPNGSNRRSRGLNQSKLELY